jgi:hypothetical protein
MEFHVAEKQYFFGFMMQHEPSMGRLILFSCFTLWQILPASVY